MWLATIVVCDGRFDNGCVLDAASFWITDYFEETKIRQIHVGKPARIMLMGFDQPVSGHVESIEARRW